MLLFIQSIFRDEIRATIYKIKPIQGLGSVNQVFEAFGANTSYIIRLNKEPAKRLEYQKEHWCLEQAHKLNIPSPKVFHIGVKDGYSFMIQNKVCGSNGKRCSNVERQHIWKQLGHYASKFHKIKRIKVDEVEENEFHKNWRARLIYNIRELNDQDSLLKNKVLNRRSHQKAKSALEQLLEFNFDTGLVHGDLGPRNSILSNEEVVLLDWGTAEINVVPHIEIGIVLIYKETSSEEFQSFLTGLNISPEQYQQMEKEIKLLNLLHHLDKYRWACDYALEDIKDYETNVMNTYSQVINLL